MTRLKLPKNRYPIVDAPPLKPDVVGGARSVADHRTLDV
jgi:hypothetical protein